MPSPHRLEGNMTSYPGPLVFSETNRQVLRSPDARQGTPATTMHSRNFAPKPIKTGPPIPAGRPNYWLELAPGTACTAMCTRGFTKGMIDGMLYTGVTIPAGFWSAD
jgi:hypothetical protein